MDHVTNLPTKASGAQLRTKRLEGSVIRIENEGGFRVLEVDASRLNFIGRDIASALEQARDIGFEQGLASVRDALGIPRR